MSGREPPSFIKPPAATASLTPKQETPMADTPMSEAPSMEPAPAEISMNRQNAITTADDHKLDQAHQMQEQQQEQLQQQQQQQQHQQHQQHQYFPPEQAPQTITDMPPANTFPREHPPREPPSQRQPTTPRQHDHNPPDRLPPILSSYPTAPDSLPQTPHAAGMSAPPPRAHTSTPADRLPHLSSYPTAPESASQTPQPGTSQVPQQGMSAAGWLVPPAASAASRITFEDYLSLSEITFEWGDSYDDKDWMRLRAILAPTLMVDYSQVNGHVWSSMPAEEFVRVMSNIGFVGDPLVHTQHHIGASKWCKISDDEAVGHHQLRAAHQRYTALDLKTVENKGHGHAMVKHFYKKVDGQWKLAGLRPTVRWNEFEFEKIFKGF